jgi:aminopeptidase N
VTYRETAVLVDPVNSSAASKQWVALVVGHELAHQWFGNLVTMVRSHSATTYQSHHSQLGSF